jgi:hypothetical protein|tara:strand:- start:13824 stop:14153 length:330 start_codon:yes stop_codon:yes gene_type:complete
MATFFRNKAVKEIGKVKVPIYTAGPSTTATVVGLSLANLTESVVSTSVLIADDTSVEAFYLKNVLLPPNSTMKVLNGGEKIIIAADNTISVIADIDASLDAVMSYVEIV